MNKKLLSLLTCLVLAGTALLAGCGKSGETAEPADSSAAAESSVPAEAPAEEPAEDGFTEVAFLTTTDMHGKCWDTDVLTGSTVKNNMLRVKTAVAGIREEFGEENVILLDNGDLFQGTPVSQVQLLQFGTGESEEPPAMALCLAEIGYDAFVLGNHEFNYAWETMSDVYSYLEESGVSVLAANVVYDGSDGEHKEDENAFKTYITRTVTVNGHEHKIGILGLENEDIPRWDLPINYPGLKFTHSGNENGSMAYEAELYISEMKEEGCECIIVAYHAGLGSMDEELELGANSEDQGLRVIKETEDIDVMVLGHDHSTGYANTWEKDKAGNEVLVVNAGGQELSKTVFRFTEGADGVLAFEITGSENLKLGDLEADEELAAKIAPYVKIAEEEVNTPIGKVEGEWDGSDEYYSRQTDTMDIINAAAISEAGKAVAEKYGDKPIEARGEVLDHKDMDMSMSCVSTSGGYTIAAGDISMKDMYRLYRYANNLLVLPLYGSEIRAIMEENAASHLIARVYDGEAYLFPKGDNYTNIIFGGLNFTYELSKPAGERVIIEGFSNGRSFEDDKLYLVVVNNYHLGNPDCGLRDYSDADAVWAQIEEENGETIQELIAAYVKERTEEDGALTPDVIDWKWSLEYTADPNAVPAYEGEIAARMADKPEEGKRYVIMNEPNLLALTGEVKDGGLNAAECEAYGDVLAAPLGESILTFSVEYTEDGHVYIRDSGGNYLTSGSNGGLSLSAGKAADDLSLWEMREANGGWFVVNSGIGSNPNIEVGLELYAGRFTTYRMDNTGIYIFNFYEIDE